MRGRTGPAAGLSGTKVRKRQAATFSKKKGGPKAARDRAEDGSGQKAARRVTVA